MYDAHEGWSREDEALFESLPEPKTVLANKLDLCLDPPSRGVALSCSSRKGLDVLITATRESALGGHGESTFIDPRHEGPLREAREALEDVWATLGNDAPDDLLAVSLAHAASLLGEITGETAAPDMIERIFRDFCIGK